MTNQEINEAVARKLWGDTIEPLWKANIPDYCHSIAAAWEVVEQIKSKKIWLDVSWEGRHWVCNVYDSHKKEDFLVWDIEADTAPMAICLAFLKLGEARAK